MLTKAQIQRMAQRNGVGMQVQEGALEQVRADWERDLRPLLPQFVSYEDARQGVVGLFGHTMPKD